MIRNLSLGEPDLPLKKYSEFLNKDVLDALSKNSRAFSDIKDDVVALESYFGQSLGPQATAERQHQVVTSKIYRKKVRGERLTKLIEEAARLRKSLG